MKPRSFMQQLLLFVLILVLVSGQTQTSTTCVDLCDFTRSLVDCAPEPNNNPGPKDLLSASPQLPGACNPNVGPRRVTHDTNCVKNNPINTVTGATQCEWLNENLGSGEISTMTFEYGTGAEAMDLGTDPVFSFQAVASGVGRLSVVLTDNTFFSCTHRILLDGSTQDVRTYQTPAFNAVECDEPINTRDIFTLQLVISGTGDPNNAPPTNTRIAIVQGDSVGKPCFNANACPVPSFEVSKTADLSSVDAAGQKINYAIVVENTGNVDLVNLQVNDPLIDTGANDVVCVPTGKGATLASGESTVCTGSYTTKQSDINAGTDIVNQVSVSSSVTGAKTAEATTTVSQTRSFTVTKTANRETVRNPGEVISYTVTVSNTGNVDLDPLQISDPLVSDLSCSPTALGASLGAGSTTICSATYTVVQADIDRGTAIVNEATVTFPGLNSQRADVSTEVVTAPAFTITKSADQTSVDSVGQTVTYTMVVANTGNVALTQFSISDPMITTGISCAPVSPGGTLPTGSSTQCTGTYAVKQTDLDSGAPLVNVASATFSQTNSLDATTSVTVVSSPALTISKTASVPEVSQAGQTITYTIRIQNSGNVALAQMQVVDDRVSSLTCSPTANAGTLPVGGSTTCTGTYVATQADINAGAALVNVASVTTSRTQSQSAMASVNVLQSAMFTIAKSASTTSVRAAGEQILYTVTVTNTGTVDLTSMSIIDNRVQLSCTPVAQTGTLAVNNPRTTCTGTYTVTQDDIDAGQNIVNTASASFSEAPSQSAMATVSTVQIPSFTLTKTANRQEVTAAGDEISYSIVVQNTGNVKLDNLQVTDSKVESTLRCAPVAEGQSLTVASSTTCTGVYTVSQQDMDSGLAIENQATAQTQQAPLQTARAVVNIVQTPSFTVEKTASRESTDAAGQSIDYAVTITNTGNIVLTQLRVSDPLVDNNKNDMTCSPHAKGGSVPVGATTTCRGSYDVTNGDMELGQDIVNTVEVNPQEVSPKSATATTTVTQRPSFTIGKTTTTNNVNVAGQQVPYSIVVTNTGNIALTGMQVTDSKLTSISCTPVPRGGRLETSSSTTCSGVYVATQADLNAGTDIINTASASFAEVVAQESSTTTPVIQNPGLTVSKVADLSVTSAADELIRYTITVKNEGNIDLSNLQLKDALVEGSSNDIRCSPFAVGAVLPSLATTVCTGSYRVTQADINAGNDLVNRVIVETTEFSPVEAIATTTVSQVSSLTITKEADKQVVDAAGQVIGYTIVVRNSGNTDLVNLAVADPRLADLSCSPTVVGTTLLVSAPSTTCTGTYVVTQQDINDGQPLQNTAQARADGVDPVSASANVNVLQDAMFTVTKTASLSVVDAAGQTISYSIVITNTGNEDLRQMRVDDLLVDSGANDMVCSPVAKGATLPVSTSTTCAGTKTATQADINSGQDIVNMVVVTFAQAGPMSAEATTSVTQTPAISVQKSVDKTQASVVDEVLTYTLVVSNEGNVDLLNLQVTDALIDTNTNDLRCTPVAEGQTVPVGGSTTCTGTYRVSQSDLNAGSPVVNECSVTSNQAGPVEDTVSTMLVQTPGFTINKVADRASVSQNGDTITYSVIVTNTGNVDLTQFQLRDDRASLSCVPVAVGGVLPVSNPVTTCTGTYVTSQADINQGQALVNVASAEFSQASSKSSTATVSVTQSPSLTVTKVGDRDLVSEAGQQIEYVVTVTNTGNMDLLNFRLEDSIVDNMQCSPTSRGSTLTVQSPTTICRGVYTATQADINLGAEIVNTVTVQTSRTNPASASTTTPVQQTPSFVVTKTADLATVSSPGEIITYSIEIQNTGNTDLDNLQATDALIDGSTNDLTCTPTSEGSTLTVSGRRTVCTGTYVVKQRDINEGVTLENVVSVRFNQIGPQQAVAQTIVQQSPILGITKSANKESVSTASELVEYTLTVRNLGNVDLDNLQVNDPLLQQLSCSPVPQRSTLLVGASTDCRGTYVVSQQDINEGVAIVNTASAGSTQVGPVVATANVNVLQNAMMTITKTSNKDSVNQAGSSIDYTIVVQNVGNEDLRTVRVEDSRVSSLTCSPVSNGGLLTVETRTMTCTGSYVVTQDDIQLGDPIVNTASVISEQVGPLSATTSTAVVQLPSFTVTKVADRGTVDAAGQTITYTIDIVNTGNTQLTQLNVIDERIDASATNDLRCSPIAEGGTIAVGSSTKCTGTYVTTQADINAGVALENVVSVTSLEFGPVVASATTSVDQKPTIAITKAASRESVDAAGTDILYTIVVTNQGNVDLTNLQVSDSRLASLSCSPTAIGSTLTVSSPETTCTGTYTVSQAEINAGETLINVATTQAAQVGPKSATAQTAVVQSPSMTIAKVADVASVNQQGQSITYTITIRNSGNVDLTGVSVLDTRVESLTCNLEASTLPVGAEAQCTGRYSVTSDDMNRGSDLVNTASARSVQTQEVTALATVSVVQNPAVTILKSANVDNVETLGQTISYQILVENTGNIALTNVQVTDSLISISCPKSALPIGDSMTCTGTHTVSQQTLNSGETIVNVATVSSNEVGPVSSEVDVPVIRRPSLSITKEADVATVAAASDVITYTIVVTNTGNVDLGSLSVQDPKLNNMVCSPVPVGQTLTVNQPTTTCIGFYTATQADINAGNPLVNTATASSDSTAAVSATATVNVLQEAMFTVLKTADKSVVSTAGEVIEYSITVTNTGSVDLVDLQIVDERVSSQVQCSPTAIGGTLPVATPITVCTATYTVTQADLNAGDPLVNVASVTTLQAGPQQAQVTTNVVRRPALTATKSADLGLASAAGQLITYTITATNVGNVDLLNFQVEDPRIATGNNDLQCSPTPLAGTLTVSSPVTTCTGTYTVQQSDINAGEPLVNTAAVSSNFAGPVTVMATTNVLRSPSLSVTKVADKDRVSVPGESITYTIVITNTGNVELTNLQVDDVRVQQSANDLSCFPTAVGSTLSVTNPTTTCSGSYVVTQADLNDGSTLVNTVLVSSEETDTVQAIASTAITQLPSLSVTKTGDRPNVFLFDNLILYTITIENTGNIDLTNIQLADSLIDTNLNDIACAPVPIGGVLQVSQPLTTCSGTYHVSQQNMNAGSSLINTVLVTSVQTDPVSASHTTPVIQRPVLQIDAHADRVTVSHAGQVIRYALTVTNAGNIDLDTLRISFPRVADLQCSPSSNTLTVAVPVTKCTGSYRVTQADINTGGAIDAVASATSAQTPTAVTTSVSTLIEQRPSLSIHKLSDVDTVHSPGDIISYSVLLENTGNVDLTNLQVADSKLDNTLTCSPVVEGGTLTVATPRTVCTGSLTVTQAHIDEGLPIENTATAQTAQTGPISAIVNVNVMQQALLTVSKVASPQSVDTVGQQISYSITITNVGNENLDNMQITDQLLNNAVTCSPVGQGSTLAVGGSTECTGSLTVTQDHLNRNQNIVNRVSVQTSQVGPVTAIATTTIAQRPAIKITKTASPLEVSAAGQVITYTMIVENLGNVDLENVQLSNPALIGYTVFCAPVPEGGVLLVSAPVTTCTATLATTQDQINAGDPIVTTTNVHSNQVGPVSDTATVTVTQLPSLSVQVEANKLSVSTKGEVILYTITIRNTGNLDLVQLQPLAPLIDNGVDDLHCSPVTHGGTLSVTQSQTICTGSYIVTQDDINAGSEIVNMVSVTSGVTTTPVTGSVSVQVTQQRSLVIEATADRTQVAAANKVIRYTTTISNTGNTDLDNLAMTTTFGSATTCNPVTLGSILPVGDKTVCEVSYVATQADINAGVSLVNSFSASSGDTQSNAAQWTTEILQAPAFTVGKTADRFSVNAAGQIISYVITIKNVGNVDLLNLRVEDPLIASNIQCNPVTAGSTLPVSVGTTTCRGRYTVTQTDIDNAVNIVNTVTVQADNFGPVTQLVTTFVNQEARLSVDVTADKLIVRNAGETVTYTVDIQNSGNIELTSLSVVDPLVPNLSCSPVAIGGTLTNSQPFTRCTGMYVVTQDVIDAGAPLQNTVTVTTDQFGPAIGIATVNVFNTNMFTVAQSADVASVSQAGDVIVYTLQVTNGGSSQLTSLSASSSQVTFQCISSTLAPSATTTCTASYTVVQGDINSGAPIRNVVSVSTAEAGPVVSIQSTPVSNTVALGVTAFADRSVFSDAGQTITFGITVVNRGSTDLTGIRLDDPLVGTVTCQPDIVSTGLAPGASASCSGFYTTTAADVTRGSIENIVSVSSGTSSPVFASFTVVKSAATASVSVSLTGSLGSVSTSGQRIDYLIRILNTGNVAVNSLQTVLDFGQNLLCPSTSVDVGAQLVCTAEYVATQNDINTGSPLVNRVTVSAPLVGSVTDNFVTVISAAQTQTFSASLASNPTSFSSAGQQIIYTFTIANTGSAPLTVQSISNIAFGSLTSCTQPTVVNVGASVNCQASYVVTSAQAQNSVSIENSATIQTSAGAQSVTHTLAKENTGMLIFQLVLDGLGRKRQSIDFSGVQVRITDAFGDVTEVNLSASGALSTVIVPGPTTVLLIESTLPRGVAVVPGTNPSTVIVPANGMVTAGIGLRLVVELKGSIYLDANGNGARDAAESGASQVVINVSAEQNPFTAQAVTDAQGDWSVWVPLNQMIITNIVAPAGTVQTQGSSPTTLSTSGLPFGSILQHPEAGFHTPDGQQPTQPGVVGVGGGTEVNFVFTGMFNGLKCNGECNNK